MVVWSSPQRNKVFPRHRALSLQDAADHVSLALGFEECKRLSLGCWRFTSPMGVKLPFTVGLCRREKTTSAPYFHGRTGAAL